MYLSDIDSSQNNAQEISNDSNQYLSAQEHSNIESNLLTEPIALSKSTYLNTKRPIPTPRLKRQSKKPIPKPRPSYTFKSKNPVEKSESTNNSNIQGLNYDDTGEKFSYLKIGYTDKNGKTRFLNRIVNGGICEPNFTIRGDSSKKIHKNKKLNPYSSLFAS